MATRKRPFTYTDLAIVDEDTGAIVGMSTMARDAPETFLGGAMQPRPTRAGNFNVSAVDVDQRIPASGSGTATVQAGISQQFVGIQIQRAAAGSTALAAAAGVSLVYVKGGSAAITADGESFVITPSGVLNKFYVHRIGA